jgi:uncharacterized oxidoreductase
MNRINVGRSPSSEVAVMNTKGNTILITGGATGIGYALAKAFVEAGNEVIICGRREEYLKMAQKQIPGVITKVCDVTDPEACEGLIGWLRKEHPAFNVLVNNAGIQNILDLTKELPVGKIGQEITTNFAAPVQLANLVIPHFMAKKEAAIINVTSGLGFIPLAIMPVYCATKCGLHLFSISLRHQLRQTSIKVFEVVPPTVDTELDKGSREKRGYKDKGIPPSEVATGTLRGLGSDQFEIFIGRAQDLYNAAHSDKAQFVFDRMNGGTPSH